MNKKDSFFLFPDFSLQSEYSSCSGLFEWISRKLYHTVLFKLFNPSSNQKLIKQKYSQFHPTTYKSIEQFTKLIFRSKQYDDFLPTKQ